MQYLDIYIYSGNHKLEYKIIIVIYSSYKLKAEVSGAACGILKTLKHQDTPEFPKKWLSHFGPAV